MLFYSGSDSHDGGLSDLVLWREDAQQLREVGSIRLQSPSWVVPHPRLPILYATQESDPGRSSRFLSNRTVRCANYSERNRMAHSRATSTSMRPAHGWSSATTGTARWRRGRSRPTGGSWSRARSGS